MVRLKGFGLREPEVRDLGQDFAFARDAVGHDDVESGDSIGSDEEEAIAEIENFADLTALQFFDPRQFELKYSFIWHGGNMRTGRDRAKTKVADGKDLAANERKEHKS
jgi:hypothetical protein